MKIITVKVEKDEIIRNIDNYKNQLKTNQEFGDFLGFNDVEYHDSVEDIKAQGGYSDNLLNGNKMHLIDQPNRRFKSSNFVPTYEDSVFLSRVTMLSNPKIVTNSPDESAGFCHFHKNNPLQIETKCDRYQRIYVRLLIVVFYSVARHV